MIGYPTQNSTMPGLRLFSCLCCLAALAAACKPEAPAAAYEASKDRTLRKEFAFASREFVQTTQHKLFPLDPRVERAHFGMNGQPPDEEVSAVAIAHPRTPAERHWNEFIVRYAGHLLRDMYGGSDKPDPLFPENVSITITLTAASPDLLQASWEVYSYGYNQAHGATSTGTLLWSLTEGRQLTAEDIFRPDRRWSEALALPLTRRLLEPEPVDEPSEGYTALQRSQSPAIVPEGLWLRFKENENERWWQGQPACLTWSELKPYLRKSLSFDVAELRWTDAAEKSCSR